MTTYLRERLLPLFGNEHVLINSEQYKWMPQGLNFDLNDHLVPDQFIAPHYLVRFRKPYKGAPHAAGGSLQTFGHFHDFAARRGISAILGAKKNLLRIYK
jgi:hypothetical protein